MPDELLDLQAEVEDLYAGPLDRFVEQRKELQLRAKQEFPAIAGRIGGLRKPTRTASAVNQLRAQARPIFDGVVESGFELRAAIGRGDPSQALKDRQSAIGRALDAIDAAWGETAPTPVQRQRIANTLQAISVGIDETAEVADERTALVVEALRGRLTADLEPPGLEVLMGLQPGRRPRVETSKAGAEPSAPKTGKPGSKASKPSRPREQSARERRRASKRRALQKKIDGSVERAQALEREMATARERVLELQDQLEQARARRAELRADLDAEVVRRRELEGELRSV